MPTAQDTEVGGAHPCRGGLLLKLARVHLIEPVHRRKLLAFTEQVAAWAAEELDR